ncbi:MAG TPA: Rieske 2Fe-2S domain-containing protein [Methylomirabilota bacterium]|nr:Rieske 2Fe-2S domain-containing protein [Methylomirabilota bacterium]
MESPEDVNRPLALDGPRLLRGIARGALAGSPSKPDGERCFQSNFRNFRSHATSRRRKMLRGFWYPATLSERVQPRKLLTMRLLEEPLAIGRDEDGRAFALRDVCPHRGMPLSAGQFDGQSVQCS